MLKVITIIKCTSFYFSLITSEIFQLTNRCRYQFVKKVMADILSTKDIFQRATLGLSKGMKKM